MPLLTGARTLCIVACMVAQAVAASVSRAAQWSMDSSIAFRTEYDDNIALTTAPHSAVWGMLIAPEIKFSADTEALKVTGGLRFSVNRYSDSQLNTIDHSLTLRSSYKTERDVFGLDFDSIRDPTLVSELLE